MHCLMLVSLLVAAASAAIQNGTIPPPDPFKIDDATPPPPDPFEVDLLGQLDPLENPMNVTRNGLALFEGDIMLTAEQRAGRKGATNPWPSRYIPFVITSTSERDRAVIMSAIYHWRRSSCIYLYERPVSYNSAPHIRFIRSSGCWSYVGRQNRNSGQSISIGSGCATLGIVAHEIGHALGFWHEQSRRDRDSYISVLTENVISGYLHNFQVQANEQSLGVPYDLGSLMHYGGFSFSRNGQPTIVTNDVLLAGKIGQRLGLSHRDRHLASLMYQCDRYCNCVPHCLNGGYVNRYCRCACPPGTSGLRCERVTGTYYGRTCGDQSVTRPGTITSRNYPSLYPAGEHCIWRVTAPAGKCIRIRFNTARVIYRSGGRCRWDWISLHLNSDSRPDRVACGSELKDATFTTTSNRLVIEMHTFRQQYPSLQTGFSASVTFF